MTLKYEDNKNGNVELIHPCLIPFLNKEGLYTKWAFPTKALHPSRISSIPRVSLVLHTPIKQEHKNKTISTLEEEAMKGNKKNSWCYRASGYGGVTTYSPILVLFWQLGLALFLCIMMLCRLDFVGDNFVHFMLQNLMNHPHGVWCKFYVNLMYLPTFRLYMMKILGFLLDSFPNESLNQFYYE